jgi:hypothetical protein
LNLSQIGSDKQLTYTPQTDILASRRGNTATTDNTGAHTMTTKTITKVSPAKLVKAVPVKSAPLMVDPATVPSIADEAAKLAASIAADKAHAAEVRSGFAGLVASHKKDLLAIASKVSTTRDKLRSIIAELVACAVAGGMARADAGRILAEALGLKYLADNKDISNAWNWAAKAAGLESRKSGAAGKTAAGDADKSGESESDSDSEAGKAIAAAVVVIADNATSSDVVTALHAWVARHKGPGREALEIIATWKEMLAAVQGVQGKRNAA